MSDVAVAKSLRAIGIDIDELKTEIAKLNIKVESRTNGIFAFLMVILGILLALFIKPLF